MVYAYDLWLPMPTKDLFDTLMMLASVNAAKDMYEKGLEEMKEFNEKYGDFLSPIAGDMLWHQENVTNKIGDAINAMYEAGIDPVRSKEGRSMLARIRANVDYGRIALNVQAAKNAEAYQKSINDLIKDNLYDPDYEKWRLGGKTLNNWNTAEDGMWTETSARPFRDVDSIVEPWVKNLEPSYDAAYTKALNDGYDYSTVSKDRIMAVIDDALPEFTKTSEGGYYRYLAEQAAGGDKEAGDALLKEWMYNRASDHTQISRVLNPERKMALEDYYDERATNRQAAKELDVYEEKKKIDAKYAAEEGGGSGGSGAPIDPLIRIYQDAATNIFGLNYDSFEAGTASSPSEMEQQLFNRQKELIKNATLSGTDILEAFTKNDAITLRMFAGAADALDRINKDEGGINAARSDIKKLKSKEEVKYHTAGNLNRGIELVSGLVRMASGRDVKTLFKNGDYLNYIISPTKRIEGSLDDDGVFRVRAEVELLRLSSDPDDKGKVILVLPGYYYDLDIPSEKAVDYEHSAATLQPSPENEHSRLARSRLIAYDIYHTKAESDDLELIPRVSYPKE